jgi:type VI secretion system protein ImpK
MNSPATAPATETHTAKKAVATATPTAVPAVGGMPAMPALPTTLPSNVAAQTPAKTTESGRSLPDLCAGLFVYVLWLRSQPPEKAPDVRVVYQRFDELLRGIDADGQRGGATAENVRLVIFALAAFADEIILSSKLPFRSAWADQPLQLTYFNENAAGEEFFTRLEISRKHRNSAAADVLESYYLCLSLGFKGRYGGSPKREKQRRTLMEQLVIDIRSARGNTTGLSPNAHHPLHLAPPMQRISVWLVPSLSIATLIIMVIVMGVFISQLAAKAASAFA